MTLRKPELWLVGCRGMLGLEVAEELEKANVGFVATDREIDITEEKAVEAFLVDHPAINVIINCAAYTAVDRAEDDEEAAFRLNAAAPGILAKNAERIGARLIHVSTDYVFNGRKDHPLSEDEPTNPLGVYGRTKREGEEAIQSTGCRYDIVRTAWLYGKHGPNFVDTMLRLMKEKDSLKVVDDQTGSPTWANDLAKLLAALAQQPNRDSEIYHFSNEGRITWYDFAEAIYEEGKSRGLILRDVAVSPCGSEEYPTKAVRPRYSLLSKDKIRREFGWKVPDWRTSLRRYFDILGKSNE